MKKNVIAKFVCLLILAATVNAQPAQKKGYTVSGTISGASTGYVYLTRSLEDDTKITDSSKLEDGKFIFKGVVKNPDMAYLKVDNKQPPLVLFLENANISIKAQKGAMRKAEVIGSPLTVQYKKWSYAWDIISNESGKYYELLDGGKITRANDPVTYKKFEDGIESVRNKVDSVITALITEYPSSPVLGSIIINRFINYSELPKVKKFYAMLNKEGKNTYFGKKIADYLVLAVKTDFGTKPSFTIADTLGKPFQLASLKGQYVLVDFWASWCGPCRKENPNLLKAYKTYHDKGFEVVGVSLDTKMNNWKNAINKDELTWYHVSDLKGWESKSAKDIGITAIPTSFLIDKEGRVIAKNLRGEALWKKLDELLK